MSANKKNPFSRFAAHSSLLAWLESWKKLLAQAVHNKSLAPNDVGFFSSTVSNAISNANTFSHYTLAR